MEWFRRRRLILCPETNEGAIVTRRSIDDLASCTRWPQRADCDQACLKQINEAGDGCLIKSVVASWYEGKTCVCCKRLIEGCGALIAPDGTSHEWSEFLPQDLPRLFREYRPLCWSCNNVNELDHLRPGITIRRDRLAEPSSPPLRGDALY